MKTHEVQLEISGATAMWTRPDTGDSPVSYPAPTYSAVKGIFESILFIPAVEIVPVKAAICSPLIYHTYVTNYGGPLRKSKLMKNRSSYQLLATVLVSVCYRFHAQVRPLLTTERILSDRTQAWLGGTTNPAHAYQQIFQRRLERGQCHAIPCLGWKEFVPDYVGPFRKSTSICKEINLVIPSMLHTVFSAERPGIFAPQFRQNVRIQQGVLAYVE